MSPNTYRRDHKHASCNGPHILGHAPLFQRGLGKVVDDGYDTTVPSVTVHAAERIDLVPEVAAENGIPVALEVRRAVP